MATGAMVPNIPGAMAPPPPMGGNMNNPTGTAGGSSTASGAPVLPNIAPGGGPSSVPGAIPSTSPAQPVGAGQPGMISSPIAGNTSQDLTNIYGAGIGGYLSDLLGNGGMNMGLLNQVNASEMNQMSGKINQGSADLDSTLGAMGVSGNSSTTALAHARYEQGAVADENAQMAQNYMDFYNQGQETLRGIIPGIMGNAGDQPNWMDYLGMGENLATTAVGLIPGL